MNAMQFHDQLYDAGVRLIRDRDTLSADVMPGADIAPYLGLIQRHKNELLKAVDLRERIIAAASVESPQFDRVAYDQLWAEWESLDSHQEDAA